MALTREPARVLVVDDDEANRDLLSRRLRQQGHRTEEAGDGEHALTLLADRDYDLVLFDIVMPKLDGYEVLARMKADERLLHVPIIVISANNEVQSVTRCLDMGADDHVTKPFNPLLLRARVEACLTKKRLRDQEQAYTRELQGFNETLTQRLTALSGVPVAINSVMHVDVVLEQILDLSKDQGDLRLFESFAGMASVALENARLFEQTKRMADDLREALEAERRLAIEKEKMGAYIPKQVVDEISRNREQKLALGGKLARGTIMFSDIRGFTRLSENLDPQAVVSFLNEYMTAMTTIIEDEGGIVDKFIGDGIMAVFMPADAGDNHAVRAARAGIRMQQRLAELGRGWRSTRPDLAGIQCRIGINTGEVVSGNIGSETRMDYTVIGDNVTVTSRIESNGRGGEVHLSESTSLEVKDDIAAVRLEPIHVKNRVQPVQVYATQVNATE